MSTAKTRKAPWKKPAPRGKASKPLTAAQKRSAQAAAKKAGRRYPNLVDNMNAAKRSKPGGKKKKKKAPARKTKRAQS